MLLRIGFGARDIIPLPQTNGINANGNSNGINSNGNAVNSNPSGYNGTNTPGTNSFNPNNNGTTSGNGAGGAGAPRSASGCQNAIGNDDTACRGGSLGSINFAGEVWGRLVGGL
jgi:hypothetical protein